MEEIIPTYLLLREVGRYIEIEEGFCCCAFFDTNDVKRASERLGLN